MNRSNAITWLKFAQDITPDGGVSAFYHTQSNVWQPSYPETSGYIIPTLLAAGETERAIRISEWLRGVQLKDGAIPQGFWRSHISNPFDTAQALLGWLAVEEVAPDKRTRESLESAVSYLEDSWSSEQWGESCRTYYARNIWPLRLAGSILVPSMIEHFTSKVSDHGFVEECEDDYDHPLSHFTCYVARAFLEIGELEYAQRIATFLADAQTRFGTLPARISRNGGRFNTQICVPAVAQAAIIWHKLGMKEDYEKAMSFIEKLDAPWASWPPEGDYLAHTHTNWSAKFIADAYAIANSNT